MFRLVGVRLLRFCIVLFVVGLLANLPFLAEAYGQTATMKAQSQKVLPSYEVGSLAVNSSYSQGYSPQQIKGAYGLSGTSYTGAGITIAVIDAYDDTTATQDFDTFSKQFGLPTVAGGCNCLTKVNQTGGSTLPGTNSGWAIETAIDIEWAHAIAPGAKILLVEANSSNLSDFLIAEDYATAHAKVVSNSWHVPDGQDDTKDDTHFNKAVAIVSSAGDSGTPAVYPATSPYVLSIGGTTLRINGTQSGGGCDGAGCSYGSEMVWKSGGGGASTTEGMPQYQQGFCGSTANVNDCSNKRGTPDLAWNADPSTGVAVYSSTAYSGTSGWISMGGTSVGAPSMAGVIALADQAHGTTLTTNDLKNRFAYKAASGTAYQQNYNDVVFGTNGTTCCTAGIGYDLASGLGSIKGTSWISAV